MTSASADGKRCSFRNRPMNATLASVTNAVVSDAAQRTGRRKADLVVESAEPVTWADGSLGCPAPGAMYTMALVPGYRIRVRAGEEVLDYHASERGYFVLSLVAKSALAWQVFAGTLAG